MLVFLRHGPQYRNRIPTASSIVEVVAQQVSIGWPIRVEITTDRQSLLALAQERANRMLGIEVGDDN